MRPKSKRQVEGFKNIALALSLILSACSQMPVLTKSRDIVSPTQEIPISPQHNSQFPPNTPSTPEAADSTQVVKPTPTPPKIGIILGPGAIKTFAHIGVLQELGKNKIPISMIAGLEWAALPAAIYSLHLQPHEVEWQFMKLREEEFIQESILSAQIKPQSARTLDGFLKTLPTNSSEMSEIPFFCPSYNVDRGLRIFQTANDLPETIKRCVTMFPLFEPYNSYIGWPFDIKSIADQMRAKGASVILFFNVLNSSDFITQKKISHQDKLLWSIVQQNTVAPNTGADLSISIRTNDIDMFDFRYRRELIQRGAMAVNANLKKILEKYKGLNQIANPANPVLEEK